MRQSMVAVMIGVDPHKGSHIAVVIDQAETVLGEVRVRASASRVQRLLAWAGAWPERTWAVEGAGGLGHLLAQQLAGVLSRCLSSGECTGKFSRPEVWRLGTTRTAVCGPPPKWPRAVRFGGRTGFSASTELVGEQVSAVLVVGGEPVAAPPAVADLHHRGPV